jgi:Zn-dependent protease
MQHIFPERKHLQLGTIQAFLDNMDWLRLLVLVMGAVGSLLCLTVHELAHGLIAYRLGDHTAKLNGRLTLNPVAHVDLMGLFLMLVVRVGWAKAVPVDMRNFKNPKRDMAITALAGPISNVIISAVFLFLYGLL